MFCCFRLSFSLVNLCIFSELDSFGKGSGAGAGSGILTGSGTGLGSGIYGGLGSSSVSIAKVVCVKLTNANRVITPKIRLIFIL